MVGPLWAMSWWRLLAMDIRTKGLDQWHGLMVVESPVMKSYTCVAFIEGFEDSPTRCARPHNRGLIVWNPDRLFGMIHTTEAHSFVASK
jgi:hypothetical protein